MIPTDSVELERALSGRRDDQSGGGSKDGGEVYPLAVVGHRYAMDGTIKQIAHVTDKLYPDLDVYLYDLPTKLTTTFLDLLDNKHRINFWIAVHERDTHPKRISAP